MKAISHPKNNKASLLYNIKFVYHFISISEYSPETPNLCNF